MSKIKQFLDERNMTQGQLAEAIKYDLSYVNQIANDKIEPTPAFRWRWLETFGPDTLRYLNGDAEPHHDPPR